MTKDERKLIADYIRENESMSYHHVARHHNLSYTSITRIAAEFEIARKSGPKSKKDGE
jgi:transposase